MIILPTADIPHNKLQFTVSVPLHDIEFEGLSPVDKVSGEHIFNKVVGAIADAYYPFRHISALSSLHTYELARNGGYLIIEGSTRLPLEVKIGETQALLAAVLKNVPDYQGILQINRQYTSEEILSHCY